MTNCDLRSQGATVESAHISVVVHALITPHCRVHPPRATFALDGPLAPSRCVFWRPARGMDIGHHCHTGRRGDRTAAACLAAASRNSHVACISWPSESAQMVAKG